MYPYLTDPFKEPVKKGSTFWILPGGSWAFCKPVQATVSF